MVRAVNKQSEDLEPFYRHWNDYTTSSSDGDSPKLFQSPPFVRASSKRTSRGSLFANKQRPIDTRYVTYVTHGQSRGVLHLDVGRRGGFLNVAVNKIARLPKEFIGLSSIIVRVSMETHGGSRIRFQTEAVPVTSQMVEFNENFQFELPELLDNWRLMLCACLRHDEPLFPDKLGWMSFGVARMVEKETGVDGWYCLLGKSLGKRKHLFLREDCQDSDTSLLNPLQVDTKRQSNARGPTIRTRQSNANLTVRTKHRYHGGNQAAVKRTQSLCYRPEGRNHPHRNSRQSDHAASTQQIDSFVATLPPDHHSIVSDRHKTGNMQKQQEFQSPQIDIDAVTSLHRHNDILNRLEKSRRQSRRLSPRNQQCRSRRDSDSYVMVQESRNYLGRIKRSKLQASSRESVINSPRVHFRRSLGSPTLFNHSRSSFSSRDYCSPISELNEFRRNSTQSKSFCVKTVQRHRVATKPPSTPRSVDRKHTLKIESARTPGKFKKYFSDLTIRQPSMLSLSTPPPSVLHSTSHQPDSPTASWSDFTLSPSFQIITDEDFKALDEITCNSQPTRRQKSVSLFGNIFDPLKLKIEKKTQQRQVSNSTTSDLKRSKDFASEEPAAKKSAIQHLGEIFKSREGHGSTVSLCTPDAYFSQQQERSSKLSRLGAFRLSKRKKFDPNTVATPMARRRKPGRYSIGDPCTPGKRLNFQRDVMFDGVDFEACADEFFKSENEKPLQRSSWKSFLPKRSTAIKKRNSEKSTNYRSISPVQDVSLIDVLRNKASVVAFKDFLKQEFSEENLAFWLDVENYRQARKFEKQAPKIYAKYIASEAPMEINIGASLSSAIKKNLNKPTANIFDEAQLHIFQLMEKDSFRRFASTQQKVTGSETKKKDSFKMRHRNI